MSHIVTISTRLKDPAAIQAACQRLKLEDPVHGTAKLYSGIATGLLVKLPGWQYPAVIDTTSGTIQFDDFEGRWGDRAQLEHLLQAYAVEKCRIEAKKKGHTVTEQQLQDGSIKLQIVELLTMRIPCISTPPRIMAARCTRRQSTPQSDSKCQLSVAAHPEA
jgi:hypothetical protein